MKVEYDPKFKLKDVENAWIMAAVVHYSHNMTVAAKALGISRATLYRKVGEINDKYSQPLNVSSQGQMGSSNFCDMGKQG